MSSRYKAISIGDERPSAIVYFVTKTFAVASNTFVESIRQPVYGVIVTLAVLLILLSPYITLFSMQQSDRMVIDMGLATIMLAGLLLAAFTASSVVSEEIENKTVLTVISKPIGRGVFVLGKFIGVLAVLAMATYLLSLTLVLSASGGAMEADSENKISWIVAITLFGSMIISVLYGIYSNFFNDKPFFSRMLGLLFVLYTMAFIVFLFFNPRTFEFGSKGGVPIPIGGWTLVIGAGLSFKLICACFMLLWSILVLAGIAVAISTRLSIVVNVCLCSGVFLLGLLSDYLFKTRDHWIAVIAYRIVPNLQVFWASDNITMNRLLPPGMVITTGVYAGFLLLASLFVAMLLFQDRQVA